APVRLPVDLLHRGCRDARKCPGIAPVGKVWRYRRERDVTRDQDHLSKYGRVGAKRRTDLRRPVEGELVRDFEPAEGWTAVIELTCVHFPIETPGPRFRRRRLDAGGNADGPPSGLLEVGRQQLASGIHQQL